VNKYLIILLISSFGCYGSEPMTRDGSPSEVVDFTICGTFKTVVHGFCRLNLLNQRCPGCYNYHCDISTVKAEEAYKMDGVDMTRDCSLCNKPLVVESIKK